MKYALVIYAEPDHDEALPDAEREAAYAEYSALTDDAGYVVGAQLQPAESATCVRVSGGRTLMTDGPFPDTKEVLGGFCLVEATAFMVSEETMKRRLSRTKAKIKATGIPFAVPDVHLLPDRLDASWPSST